MPSHRFVIKLGTSTLTSGSHSISKPVILEIARQIAMLREEGNQVILVTSGAIAAGREVLDYADLPKYVPAKQMLSALGQPKLMALYSEIFGYYGLDVAQILLTRADLSDRRRYLNARNTLEALLMQGVIPVINENDTVATEEIRVGDNDNLSALVANLVEADILILLTDQLGVYTGDPRTDPSAVLIPLVDTPDIPETLWLAAGGSITGLGTGGMVTKLQAADLARRSGTTVYIASGKEKDVLLRISEGESVGTRFCALINKVESRKRYMLAGLKASRGKIIIDDGAVSAIRSGGSLLPVGVKDVKGRFERGDPVRILDMRNTQIALGLVNYTYEDVNKIKGHHSTEIEPLLGYTFGDEVIHHNNMVLLSLGDQKHE